MSFAFNISEIEHASKKLTSDIAITPKILMDKPKRNILPYPFKQNNGDKYTTIAREILTSYITVSYKNTNYHYSILAQSINIQRIILNENQYKITSGVFFIGRHALHMRSLLYLNCACAVTG